MQTSESDLAVAHALADAAEIAILPHFRSGRAVENKLAGGFDPVTEADRSAEHAMRRILAEKRPGDAVHGEEYSDTAGDSGRTWILDPIDGTRAFMMGLPTWGVLIALADPAGPGVGMMAQPFTGDRFFAAEGRAWLRDRRGERAIAARRCASIGDAVMATTDLGLFSAPLRGKVETLAGQAKLMRYGTDCYAYALLAAGLVDVVVETGLKAVDIGPFTALIEAAGGALTDFAGDPIAGRLPAAYNGEAVAVGDPALLPAVLAAIS